MSWLTVQIGRFIHRALLETKKAQEKAATEGSVPEPALVARTKDDPFDIPAQQTTFTVLKAANGRLIKVSEYKPTKSHHSDWQHEVYIVKDDEKVPDVIARIMAIKSLEQ